MQPEEPPFHEAHLPATRLRDLGLKLEGTPLWPLTQALVGELRGAGLRRLTPRFYLSTEWGVPTGTVALAIPFYLARPDLSALHAARAGHVEGEGPADILRYLRHEAGHVVNYAYRLFLDPEWTALFGAIDRPYREEYRPEPFSTRYVSHLPGWYAQKHPDEDWAETFAVWLTPGRDWRKEYAPWPVALEKLLYCDRAIAALGDTEPPVQAADLDEDVGELDLSLEQLYGQEDAFGPWAGLGLEGALRAIFDDLGEGAGLPAAELLRRLERDLSAQVYRFTGHFPERTRALVRHLAELADLGRHAYAARHEARATVALTALVTALAMNHVHRGAYAT